MILVTSVCRPTGQGGQTDEARRHPRSSRQDGASTPAAGALAAHSPASFADPRTPLGRGGGTRPTARPLRHSPHLAPGLHPAEGATAVRPPRRWSQLPTDLGPRRAPGLRRTDRAGSRPLLGTRGGVGGTARPDEDRAEGRRRGGSGGAEPGFVGG